MKRLTIFAAALSFILAAHAQQPKNGAAAGYVTGEVMDVMGAAISNASVYVRAYAPASEKMELLTHADHYGKFSLTLPAGAYDILITALGFEAKAQTILVRLGNTRKTEWKLTLPPESCDFPGFNCDDFPEFRKQK